MIAGRTSSYLVMVDCTRHACKASSRHKLSDAATALIADPIHVAVLFKAGEVQLYSVSGGILIAV